MLAKISAVLNQVLAPIQASSTLNNDATHRENHGTPHAVVLPKKKNPEQLAGNQRKHDDQNGKNKEAPEKKAQLKLVDTQANDLDEPELLNPIESPKIQAQHSEESVEKNSVTTSFLNLLQTLGGSHKTFAMTLGRKTYKAVSTQTRKAIFRRGSMVDENQN